MGAFFCPAWCSIYPSQPDIPPTGVAYRPQTASGDRWSTISAPAGARCLRVEFLFHLWRCTYAPKFSAKSGLWCFRWRDQFWYWHHVTIARCRFYSWYPDSHQYSSSPGRFVDPLDWRRGTWFLPRYSSYLAYRPNTLASFHVLLAGDSLSFPVALCHSLITIDRPPPGYIGTTRSSIDAARGSITGATEDGGRASADEPGTATGNFAFAARRCTPAFHSIAAHS